MAYDSFLKQAVAARRHYLLNSSTMKDRARAHEKKIKKQGWIIVEAARAVACQDCHGSFPGVCMDFDHVRGKKLFDVTRSSRWGSLGRLREEIAKCEVVCSNCHRLRTTKRRAEILARQPQESAAPQPKQLRLVG